MNRFLRATIIRTANPRCREVGSKCRSSYTREMMRLAIGILLLSSFLACTYQAPITVPLHSSRLDPPELSSKPQEVSVGFSVRFPNEIVIIPDGIADPPILNNPKLGSRKPPLYISPHLGVSVIKRLELSYDICSGLLLRTQLFGKRREEATVGNKSIALSLGYNFTSNSHELTKSDRPNSDQLLAEYDWRLNSTRSNLLFGYRFHRSVLYYCGVYYESYSLRGQLDQYAFPNIIESDQKYSLNSQGYEQGFGMGVEFLFDAKVAEQSIIYTLQVSEISWGTLSTDTVLSHSLIVKYYF